MLSPLPLLDLWPSLLDTAQGTITPHARPQRPTLRPPRTFCRVKLLNNFSLEVSLDCGAHQARSAPPAIPEAARKREARDTDADRKRRPNR